MEGNEVPHVAVPSRPDKVAADERIKDGRGTATVSSSLRRKETAAAKSGKKPPRKLAERQSARGIGGGEFGHVRWHENTTLHRRADWRRPKAHRFRQLPVSANCTDRSAELPR